MDFCSLLTTALRLGPMQIDREAEKSARRKRKLERFEELSLSMAMDLNGRDFVCLRCAKLQGSTSRAGK